MYSSHYYARCFGIAKSWNRLDKGHSHHLDVQLQPVVDLDNASLYNNFTANVNLKSDDNTNLYVAQLDYNIPFIDKLSGELGLMKLDNGQGVDYNSIPLTFQPMSEDNYQQTLSSLLENSTTVYLFGQAYIDQDDVAGIHDIHKNQGDNDGCLVTLDNQGIYHAVFSHFR